MCGEIGRGHTRTVQRRRADELSDSRCMDGRVIFPSQIGRSTWTPSKYWTFDTSDPEKVKIRTMNEALCGVGVEAGVLYQSILTATRVVAAVD